MHDIQTRGTDIKIQVNAEVVSERSEDLIGGNGIWAMCVSVKKFKIILSHETNQVSQICGMALKFTSWLIYVGCAELWESRLCLLLCYGDIWRYWTLTLLFMKWEWYLPRIVTTKNTLGEWSKVTSTVPDKKYMLKNDLVPYPAISLIILHINPPRHRQLLSC